MALGYAPASFKSCRLREFSVLGRRIGAPEGVSASTFASATQQWSNVAREGVTGSPIGVCAGLPTRPLRRFSAAMAAGLTDKLLDMSEIAAMVEATLPKPGRPATYAKREAAQP